MKRQNLKSWLIAVAAAGMLSACDMMTVDLDDCPTGLYVNFVYDYNIQRADMFKDHVGGLTLYVYDEADRLAAQRTVSGSELQKYGYCIHFTEKELAPDHTYRLQAVALQKDWSAALSTPGAKYRKTELATGDDRKGFSIKLDRQQSAIAPYYGVSAVAPLDTLWHTLTTLKAYEANVPAATKYHEQRDGSIQSNGVETFTVKTGEPTYATVSLIRDTNHLNISLREIDNPGDVSHEDYEVFIVDANGDVDCNNNLITPTDSLIYLPYAQWTTAYDGNGTMGVQRSAHYDLMFNRLKYSASPKENAVLFIRKKSTNQDVAVLNLAEVLCEGRTAYEIYSYRPQEYLDREYDYRLEFFLKGEKWIEVSELYICIDVLSWAKRIQIENL
jgi:hypothetical protein